jgi:hypothetical protein
VSAGLRARLALLVAAAALAGGCRTSPAPESAAPRSGPFEPEAELAGFAPAGYAADGPARRLDEDDLEERYGALDLFYSDVGFRHAVCQRYAPVAGGRDPLEACVYVMRDRRAALSSALAVRQSLHLFGRKAGGPSPVHEHGWEAPGFLSFAQGEIYVEVVAGEPPVNGVYPPRAAPAADAAAAHRAIATALAARHGGAASPLPPFPAEGQRPGRLRLIVRNAFGMESLDGIFTADYAVGGAEALAFWSDRASPAEAEALARAWLSFLRANGAAPAEPPLPDTTALELLGFTEVVCVRGHVVAGVHQADTVDIARRLAAAVCPPPGG